MYSRLSIFRAITAFVCISGCVAAQAQTFAEPQAQIVKSVDESTTITLPGNIHPLATTATASQAADFATPMQHMILYLSGDATQEATLTQLIAAQHDPKSPLYHQFLTPQTFGAQFGAAQADIAKVTAWLESHGFSVEQVPAGNRAIVFSGTSAQVEDAFKTQIRQYTVAGASHYANASNPQIPAALAGAVGGIVKLNDFQHSAHLKQPKPLTAAQVANPQYTGGSGHYLAPSDYGIIYDINPLYTAGINGTGQTIAVLARSNIYMSDVQSFRSFSGLPANNPQIVITNSDPGVLQGDSVETTLDTEWSGAVAPKAAIKVIVSASTNSADGIDLSALYAVNNNVAPIISLSYGSCEAWMGSGGLNYYNSLWKQAAAQGQSVMVSAGDSGAAGCDGGSESTGYYGQGVNGLCSSPYSTCVGGTQFADNSNPGQYWLPGNNSTNGSAISYIPESIWNESGSNGGSGLWSGGGGASIAYTKPAWQTGPGVPADGKRDVPDISLTAAGHDGYLIWLYGGLNSVGGTSASAPSFAGLMALVDQKIGSRQGLANSILYPLASNQAAGGAKVFHDIVSGNNTVPGVTGFPATAGYDMASGIGTVDANLLINHWTDTATTTGTLSLSTSSTSLTVVEGGSGQTTLTTTASANLKSAVTLSVTGAPTGVTATLASTTIASPGSGTAVLKIAATSAATPGTYTLTVTGTGGGQTAQTTVSVVIPTPTFNFSASASSASVMQGSTAPFTVSTTPENGFSTAVTLSISGLPAGVTAAFSPATIVAAGGASTVTLTAAKTATGGSYPLTITAKAGSLTKTTSLTLVVTVPASCTLAANPASLSITAGATPSAVQVSCASPVGTFNGAMTLSVSGAPTGLTAQLTAASLTPGSYTNLTVSSAATLAGGNYTLSLTAAGSGFTKTITLPITVANSNSFSLSAGAPSLTVQQNASQGVSITSTLINKFNAAVTLGVTGLPAGVTAAWSKPALAAPGSGSSVITFTAASSAKTGTYNIALTGTGGGIVQSVPLTLTVGYLPNFSFSLNVSALSIPQGSQGTVIVSTGNYTGGFNGQITMSYSQLPAGLTWGMPSGSAANNMVNISLPIAVAANAPTGSYPVTITDTGNGGIVHSGTVMVTVTAAATQTKH